VGKIIHIEDRSKRYKFEEQVIEVLSEKNNFYEFLEDGDNGVAYLHFKSYRYIFFVYVPRGTSTELPTLTESLCGLHTSPKISKGQWCVDKVLSIESKIALKTLPLIFSSSKPDEWILNFKEQIYLNIQKEGEKNKTN
jgi:hypothetical protein